MGTVERYYTVLDIVYSLRRPFLRRHAFIALGLLSATKGPYLIGDPLRLGNRGTQLDLVNVLGR